MLLALDGSGDQPDRADAKEHRPVEEKMFERAEQPDEQTDACAKEIQFRAQRVCQIS
jgi:hypothetical protein